MQTELSMDAHLHIWRYSQVNRYYFNSFRACFHQRSQRIREMEREREKQFEMTRMNEGNLHMAA